MLLSASLMHPQTCRKLLHSVSRSIVVNRPQTFIDTIPMIKTHGVGVINNASATKLYVHKAQNGYTTLKT